MNEKKDIAELDGIELFIVDVVSILILNNTLKFYLDVFGTESHIAMLIFTVICLQSKKILNFIHYWYKLFLIKVKYKLTNSVISEPKMNKQK